MCQHREAPMSPSQDQVLIFQFYMHTSAKLDSNRSSLIETPIAKTSLHPSKPSWLSSQFSGHNSSFRADQKAEIPSLTLIDQHVSFSVLKKVKVYFFFTHLALFFQILTLFPIQRNDGSPSSSLDDGEAFFTKLD
ncbi:hypothetical protein Q3G72_013158 [Acer saccharum]|nr:hypothetical protein Q3G72_013158 [Acer saccharum]